MLDVTISSRDIKEYLESDIDPFFSLFLSKNICYKEIFCRATADKEIL